MRDIGKYRGQRVDNGAWVYGDLIHFPATTAIGHPDKGGVYWEEYDVIPETVGMYTGINDKNKREIYGSIPINGKMSDGGDKVKWCTLIWTIKFIDGKFGFGWKDSDHLHSQDLYIQCYHNAVEVIGHEEKP